MLFMVLGLALGITAADATQWPNGAKAAVVLTYDDALRSQFDHVIPVLDAKGFKGTFFLANVKLGDVQRWRAVANEGHERANHTIFHACAATQFPADPRYTTEAYTPASMLREIEQHNVLLTALDGREEHGFGTPCGKTIAGGVDYLPALRKAKLVSYVRAPMASLAELSADVSSMDSMHIPSTDFPKGVTGAQLIDFAKKAEAGGSMADFVFHGVGADYLRVSDAEHKKLIAWLAEHRSDVWVASLRDALAWAKAHADKASWTPTRQAHPGDS
ncbi:MAG: polysaccharide deacetylase family protein [Rhodanobacter sp.]